ncbi:hypothetical protein Vretimale_10547 [Volvox reticuliferus]|uniref:Uncharacterized protein n=1 Tax=Volvox reticuliferus TaxID=1737510 RepID=A0A8J4GFD3_9CHLO|nr:hypothetical protein Vretimale_10547 [Volvox reticuliferus]
MRICAVITILVLNAFLCLGDLDAPDYRDEDHWDDRLKEVALRTGTANLNGRPRWPSPVLTMPPRINRTIFPAVPWKSLPALQLYLIGYDDDTQGQPVQQYIAAKGGRIISYFPVRVLLAFARLSTVLDLILETNTLWVSLLLGCLVRYVHRTPALL